MESKQFNEIVNGLRKAFIQEEQPYRDAVVALLMQLHWSPGQLEAMKQAGEQRAERLRTALTELIWADHPDWRRKTKAAQQRSEQKVAWMAHALTDAIAFAGWLDTLQQSDQGANIVESTMGQPFIRALPAAGERHTEPTEQTKPKKGANTPMAERVLGLHLPRLKHHRMRAGLNQRELAKESGVARATINKAENGGRVTTTSARRIANALGVKIDQLADDDKDHAA